MDRTMLTVAALGGAIVGGVVGSLFTLALHEPARASAPPREETGEYDVAIERLEKELRSLKRKVGLLARALGHESPTVPASGGAGGATAVDNPLFEVAVRDVVERMESEQDTPRSGHGYSRHPQDSPSLAERLDLSDEQKRQLQRINMKHLEGIRALRAKQDEGGTLLRSEWRREMQVLRRKADEALRALLTPQQLQSYESIAAEGDVGGKGRPRDTHFSPAGH